MMTPKQLSRLKVSVTYLTIIMLLSIVFSFAIYIISDRELSGQRRLEIPRGMRTIIQIDEFDVLREAQLQKARDNLRQKLIAFNIMTLLFGGVLSYYMALRSLRPIEEALERQDRFTSDASHEIRTPLTAMRSEIEVALRDKKLNMKDAKQILESNLEEVTRLEALTAGLLSLARQENNLIEKKKIPTKDLIDESVKRVEALAEEKLIKIKVDQPKKSSLFADETSLLQVLVILLDNAIKYSPSGSDIQINVKNTRIYNEISILDSGSGITKEDLPHVFDRFYRSDKSRTKDKDKNGYGLGLAIAKEIIDAHKGDITIQSAVGTGTNVKLSLPKK